jgi:hypothetical protein
MKKNVRTVPSLEQPKPMRRVAYTLAAGAAAGVAAGNGASEADAQIVYSGLQNISIGQFSYQNLNLDGDAFGDVKLKNYVFGGNYQGATVGFFPGQLVISNNSFPFYVTALSKGQVIDVSSVGPSFYGSMAYGANPNAEFDNVENAYLGLSFPSGANLFYGWVRVAIDNTAGTFLIKDWAYNSISGEGIRAGEIPEPASLGMLAAGAAGLVALRRKRKAAA